MNRSKIYKRAMKQTGMFLRYINIGLSPHSYKEVKSEKNYNFFLAQKDVSHLFGEENPQRLRYDAQFMFSDDFNLGDIPVWIVIIYDGHQAKWKGVYGYKGQAMSLVPFCQDFETYTTDGEDFLSTFWEDNGGEEREKLP